jgi:hypothetical protein
MCGPVRTIVRPVHMCDLSLSSRTNASPPLLTRVASLGWENQKPFLDERETEISKNPRPYLSQLQNFPC